jgi:hypothetical protein
VREATANPAPDRDGAVDPSDATLCATLCVEFED